MKKKKTSPLLLIGRTEKVKFRDLCFQWIEAKIDTGAYGSCLDCHNIREEFYNGKKRLCFSLALTNTHSEPIYFESYSKKKVKSSTGEVELRYLIKTPIEIAGKKIISTISLTDRASMKYPVLIGRKLLRNKFIVDVSKINTGGIPIEEKPIKHQK